MLHCNWHFWPQESQWRPPNRGCCPCALVQWCKNPRKQQYSWGHSCQALSFGFSSAVQTLIASKMRYCATNIHLSKRMWRKYLICFIPTVTPTGPTDVSCGITMTPRTKSFTLKYPNPKITVPDQPKPFLEHTSSQTEGTPLPCMQRFAFHSNLDILPVAPCMRMCLESPISPPYNPAAGNSLPGVWCATTMDNFHILVNEIKYFCILHSLCPLVYGL